MFVDFISQYLTSLVSSSVASVLAEVIATLLSLMLLYLFFSLFMDYKTKHMFLRFVLVIVGVMAVFSIAKYYGFIVLPIKLT